MLIYDNVFHKLRFIIIDKLQYFLSSFYVNIIVKFKSTRILSNFFLYTPIKFSKKNNINILFQNKGVFNEEVIYLFKDIENVNLIRLNRNVLKKLLNYSFGGKKVNPAIIYAAKKCGVKEIYKTGGPHSIAAFTYGTKSFKKVDKIVGPGNAYVACAKKEVYGDVGIDMVAGPSEVSIIADKFSNPNWIAADLIAQAEHDIFSQSILITDSKDLIKLVNKNINEQLINIPKKKIALQSLKNYGFAIYAKNKKTIIEIVNSIAPEHLEIDYKNNKDLLSRIKNAGSIFLGKFSPEAMGDYIAGPNHVLPTSGTAKFASGLSVSDFLKRHSLIKITKSGIERLGPSVINLARHENLDGHANSIKIRLKKDY